MEIVCPLTQPASGAAKNSTPDVVFNSSFFNAVYLPFYEILYVTNIDFVKRMC